MLEMLESCQSKDQSNIDCKLMGVDCDSLSLLLVSNDLPLVQLTIHYTRTASPVQGA